MAPPTKKRSNSFIENSDEELGDKPKSKSVKKEKTAEAENTSGSGESKKGNGIEIEENKEGDKYFEIGNNRSRRVTVSSFKNTPLIDIREFYTNKEGVSAPGKKGVSLKPDEVSGVSCRGLANKHKLQLIVDNYASIKEMLDGLNIKRK